MTDDDKERLEKLRARFEGWSDAAIAVELDLRLRAAHADIGRMKTIVKDAMATVEQAQEILDKEAKDLARLTRLVSGK